MTGRLDVYENEVLSVAEFTRQPEKLLVPRMQPGLLQTL